MLIVNKYVNDIKAEQADVSVTQNDKLSFFVGLPIFLLLQSCR